MSGSKTMKLASAAAVASVLAMPAFVGEANAAAKAFSSLAIQDFIISDAEGQLDAPTDFDVIDANNTGQNSATLDGGGPVFSAGPAPADADAAHACVGADCGAIGENNFNQQGFPPPNTFARADSRILGTSITGVPGASQSNVDANTVAEAQILEPNRPGSGSSDVGTDTEFSFSLAEDRQLTFSFSARGLLELRLDPDSDGSTGANFNFSITIRDSAGAIVFQWTPDGTAGGIIGGTETADGANLTQDVSLLAPGTTSVDTGLAAFSATTNFLSALQTYNLTISHGSFARAIFQQVAIPEPASLALFSFGLLAFGLIAKQRRRNDGGAA